MAGVAGKGTGGGRRLVAKKPGKKGVEGLAKNSHLGLQVGTQQVLF